MGRRDATSSFQGSTFLIGTHNRLREFLLCRSTIAGSSVPAIYSDSNNSGVTRTRAIVAEAIFSLISGSHGFPETIRRSVQVVNSLRVTPIFKALSKRSNHSL